MSQTAPTMLRASGLRKAFPGVCALDGVDLAVAAGEVHALMGENGAGKSTLIKVLTGVQRPDAGTIELGGARIAPRSPHHAEALGIACVHQEVALIPHLSVADNICLAREPGRCGFRARRTARRRAREALSRLGMELDVDRELGSYSIAIGQLVAIARALDVSARVLILDEPTSSLDQSEVGRLFETIRRLRGEGLGIVLVTHFLDQVYAIADRVTILRDGRLVGCHPLAGLSREALVGLMIGRTLAAPAQIRDGVDVIESAGPASPALSARGLGRRGAIEPFDLDLVPGRTTGLAGLLGSGRTEAARLLFGLDRPSSGATTVAAKPVRLRSPRGAISHGIAFTPEDRKLEGLVPDLSVRDNIILALQASRGPWRRLGAARRKELADRMIARLRIRVAGPHQQVRALSGGNQQKVLLARWLIMSPRVLILDEPTRGIDVGAREEVETLIEELRAGGMAVLLITAELDHLARAASDVLVLRDRRVVGRLSGPDGTEGNILRVIASAPGASTDTSVTPEPHHAATPR